MSLPTRAEIVDLQCSLLVQGYSLPRWGADGWIGDETQAAIAEWEDDHGAIEGDLSAVVAAIVAHGASLLTVTPGDRVLDVRALHGRTRAKGRNPWARIDTVCLHQMACCGPGGWKRWKDLAIHFAALREGQVAWLYDCDTLLWHGHGWNSRSVGIEVEGWFAGIEGRPGTLWAPRGADESRRTPMVLGAEQAEACMQAIRLAVATVRAAGGAIRYVAAHRQSCSEKQSDPGEAIWRQVALPAMLELGLETAPTLRGGSPIPGEWDERSTARY